MAQLAVWAGVAGLTLYALRYRRVGDKIKLGAARPFNHINTYCEERYMSGAVCRSGSRLDGKVILITGANEGLGKETAIDLARRGGRIIMACRSMEKAAAAAADVRRAAGVPDEMVKIMKLDLASFKCVRKFAENFQKGHFLLTHLLLEMLKSSAPSRIINISSQAHVLINKFDFDDISVTAENYSGLRSYNNSKLANIYFTKQLATRLEGTGVTTYAVHPGLVGTEIRRDVAFLNYPGISQLTYIFRYPFMKTASEGAQTQIYCAVEESLASQTGLYYADCAIKEPSKAAIDEEAAKRVWEISEELCGLKPKHA